MKRMSRCVRAGLAAAVAAVMLFCAPPAAWAADEIYIAGASEEWPFEYYDDAENRYRGILPDLLEEAGETAGLSIAYVDPSSSDMRLSMAANVQVDAVFDIGLSDREIKAAGLEMGTEVCSYMEDGERKTVHIAYTKSMTSGERERLNSAFSSVNSGQTQELLLKYAREGKEREKRPLPQRIIFIAVLAGIAACLILLPWMLFKKKREIEALVFTDDVTGRDNLAAWKRKYGRKIVDENKQSYAVLYMYTGMDMVSHIYGYEEADAAMKLIGNECAAFVAEETEGFARINEFCYVFFIHYTGVATIKERIRQMHGAISSGLTREKKKYFPELSTGIYRLNNQDMEILKIIQYSEVAMEYARSHSLEYAVYDEFVEQETISGYMMEHEAVHGLMNREFIIYLQPVMDLDTGKICGAETLVRWQNPNRGLLKPADFMKTLKRKQLVGKMNMEVYRQGCYFLSVQRQRQNRLNFIFNFTVENVGDEMFVSQLEAVADQYEISRDQIVIQLNQVVEMSQSRLFTDTIKKLREGGFDVLLGGLELDRVFFEYLKSGISGIKLRPELIGHTDTEEGRAVVKSIVDLCFQLKLKVLCVGVENGEQAEWLKSIGCSLASGFYYCYPVSPEVFGEMVTG